MYLQVEGLASWNILKSKLKSNKHREIQINEEQQHENTNESYTNRYKYIIYHNTIHAVWNYNIFTIFENIVSQKD